MRNPLVLLSAFVFPALVVASDSTLTLECDKAEAPDLAELSSAHADATGDAVPWKTAVLVCNIGSYRLYLPDDSTIDSTLVVLKSDEPLFYQMGGNRDLWDDGRIVASLKDENGDGKADLLAYNAYHDGFSDNSLVIDKNIDGQPDLRLRSRKGQPSILWVWVANGWHKMVDDSTAELPDGRRAIYEWTPHGFEFVSVPERGERSNTDLELTDPD